jgi:hypothetical protein
MFELHVIQAMKGDCLLLVHGRPEQPHYMLIDGGPATVYTNHLRPVLAGIAARGGRLDQVVLSHTDEDHVAGLVDLFAELRSLQLQNQPPLIGVDGMWINSFAFDSIVAPHMAHIVVLVPSPAGQTEETVDSSLPQPAFGIAEGMDLRELLAQLSVPVNSGFPNNLVCLESALEPVTMAGLKLTMVGPTKSNLDRLERDWFEWLQKQQPPEGVVSALDLTKRISPDQSIPNRGSIVFVAEYDGRTILFTADGRASDVTRGLIRCGLMEKDGVFHVDVLKVPHHGSARNASRKFFSQVTADTYVFSADGTNDNPDLLTLGWLVEALKEQGRKASLLFTNLTPSVEELCKEFPPALYGYTIEILDPDRHALVVALS